MRTAKPLNAAMPRNRRVARHRNDYFSWKALRLSGVELLVLLQQLVFGLDKVGVLHNAFRRANQLALRLVFGADALGAFVRIDLVNRVACSDRLVRTHRLTGIASGAVL